MTRVSEIVERLEKLTRPSKALDRDIWETAAPKEYREYCSRRSAFVNRDWSQAEKDAAIRNAALSASPDFTKSIDAALTLVPEGFKWKCGYGRHVPHTAELRDYRDKPILGTFIGECDSNRAIALCIAALRAREESAHD